MSRVKHKFKTGLTDNCLCFAASVKGEITSELASSSGVSTAVSVGSSGADATGHDIITEQPRSQHTLQSDSVDLAGCDLASAATEGDDDEVLSRSSSQISAVQSDATMDLNDGTQASSPISDSSQTTTEGPDSAVTPSDSSEIVSVQRAEGGSPSTEGPDMSQSSSMEGPDLDSSPYSSSTFQSSASNSGKVSTSHLCWRA